MDRDGVLLEVVGTVLPRSARSVEEARLVRGAPEAVRLLREKGFAVVVVTNQPDIARGTLTEHDVQRMHDHLRAQIPVDAIYHCPHDDDDGCDCRKPRPGLLLRAARDHHLDLSRSCLIGDRWVDIGAAQAAGVDGILLETDQSWTPSSRGTPPSAAPPTFAGRTLPECVRFILASGRYG